MIVKDCEAADRLMRTACEVVHETERLKTMEKNIALLALPDAARTITDEIYKIIG